MKSIKLTALLLLSLGLARSASGLPYNLESASASILGGNQVSTFYQVSGAGVETLGTTAIDWFTASTGGNETDGFWVNISFGATPQPYLASAFLKAGNGYLLWDSSDLVAFNAGDYDSITLWNSGPSGIVNGNGKYKGTSHAGFTAGIEPTITTFSVPDASSTVALLGLGMMGLFVAARRRAST